MCLVMSVSSQTKHFKIDATSYYEALSSTDIKLIDSQLNSLKNAGTIDLDAYIGTLMMKKSNFEKKTADKIELFKNGKILLENAIVKYPNNNEFKFLRLTIQENCPEILKYNDQIKADSKIVIDNFKLFSPEVKQAILEFSKTSKSLSSSNLNVN